jgi:hypothetical protein
VGKIDLGSAAAAAVRAEESNEARCDIPGPEEKRDHPTQGGQDQTTTPVGPPDDEILGEQAARRLLEVAGRYTRQALRFPDDVANLQTLVAELLLENSMLRLDVQRLSERVDRLERRSGG